MARSRAARPFRTAAAGAVCVVLLTVVGWAAFQHGQALLLGVLCLFAAVMAVALRAVARPRVTPRSLLVAAAVGAVLPLQVLGLLWLGLNHPRLYTVLSIAAVVFVAWKLVGAARREVSAWRAFHPRGDVVE